MLLVAVSAVVRMYGVVIGSTSSASSGSSGTESRINWNSAGTTASGRRNSSSSTTTYYCSVHSHYNRYRY